mmetsp:Transcript_39684/g.101424  ORF Transcript_39684/g.101424 Transcript_39684/m.101424 type:complete len:260 (+) Transcript_39684:132-911(+)
MPSAFPSVSLSSSISSSVKYSPSSSLSSKSSTSASLSRAPSLLPPASPCSSASCCWAKARMRLACQTSITIRSVICPSRMPACTAAPTATASSGSTVSRGTTPVTFSMKRLMPGMRVAPPTSSTSVTGMRRLLTRPACFLDLRALTSASRDSSPRTSPRSTPACQQANSIGCWQRRKSGAVSRSILPLVSTTDVPAPSAPPTGMRITTLFLPLSSTLAVSAIRLRLATIAGSFTSTPAGPRCSSASHWEMAASQSSPPR